MGYIYNKITYRSFLRHLLCPKCRFKFDNKASTSNEYDSNQSRTTNETGTTQCVVTSALSNGDENCCSDVALADFETCALSSDNLLNAGTQVKNTEHVFAVCVYSGAETKVQ